MSIIYWTQVVSKGLILK